MLYDITRPMTSRLAVWPGDTPFNQQSIMQIASGDSVNLSTLTLSAHTGTHADAPLHFDDQGASISELALDSYIGRATIVELNHTGPILPNHLSHVALDGVERLLLRTPNSQTPDEEWPSEIAYPTPALADLLGQHRVRLFGTDAPSVDHLESKTLDGHHALHRNGISILEGLQLTNVPVGDYELIALPIKLPGDGSPVRAILRTIED